VLAMQTAWFREAIHYRDPLIGFNAPSAYDSYLLDFTTDHQLSNPRWRLRSGGQLQWTQASAQEYGQSQQLGRLAVFATLTQAWRARPWTTDYSLRVGGLSTGQPLWSLSWRTASATARHWRWSVRLARDFRLPGLNDLFWRPGGKADLQAELAYAQEGVLHYQQAGWGHWQFRAFNRWVHNWIQWSQLSSGLFAVDNINRVWNRGLSLSWEQRLTHWQLGLEAQYARSTYQVAMENPRIERGEQLWYTPVWQLEGSLAWEKSGWQVRYQHQYTGATAGISAELADYQLADFSLRYRQLKGRLPWQLQLALNNCWNIDYQVIEFRPLPGRHWSLSGYLHFGGNKAKRELGG
jgi:iron complex outermembrane receptor protein